MFFFILGLGIICLFLKFMKSVFYWFLGYLIVFGCDKVGRVCFDFFIVLEGDVYL